MLRKKTLSIKIENEDYQFIKDLAKKDSSTILQTVSKLVASYKEKEKIEEQSLVPLVKEDVRFQELVSAIKKMLVTENNRILGIYFNTDKLIKDMYRDMHFLNNSEEYQKGKIDHPFIADYKLMHSTLRKLLKIKYKINSDEALIESMGDLKLPGLVKDYFDCLARTKSGLVSYMKNKK